MRSLQDLARLADELDVDLHEAVLASDSEATGVMPEEIFNIIFSRLQDMRRSVEEARKNTNPCRLVRGDAGALIREYADRGGMCGGFLLRASAIAIEVASYNASM
jgi:L-serine dehydratase